MCVTRWGIRKKCKSAVCLILLCAIHTIYSPIIMDKSCHQFRVRKRKIREKKICLPYEMKHDHATNCQFLFAAKQFALICNAFYHWDGTLIFNAKQIKKNSFWFLKQIRIQWLIAWLHGFVAMQHNTISIIYVCKQAT